MQTNRIETGITAVIDEMMCGTCVVPTPTVESTTFLRRLMFASSQSLLNNIPCPAFAQGTECHLLNCIFCHELESSKRKNIESEKVETVAGHPSKRQKVPASSVVSKEKEKKKLESASEKGSVRIDLSKESESERKEASASQTNSSKKKDLPNALPRQVLPFSPAPLPQRTNCMKFIQKAFLQSKHPFPNWATVEYEYKVAKASSKITYMANIRTLVKEINQGKHKYTSKTVKQGQDGEKQKAIDKELESLVIPKDVLKNWGYAVEPVVPKDLDTRMTTTCARCGDDFDIGSKREVTCKYHLLKPMFKFDTTEGRKTKSYGCCSQSDEESQGCCVSSRHVFKLDDLQLLAGVVPFSPTPEKRTPSTLFAVGIDCEMGYTSFGVELIRVTIVDWRTRKPVLDRTVFPYGEVIDLNTRFSGVHSLKDGLTAPDGTRYDTISFKEARELVFKYISSSTIIIGHGLENDLNALRLLHSRVIDTALRYPTFKPIYRVSLKQLAFKYLSREIQDGEHDSSEDAIAAMDVVLVDIQRRLKK
jgi:RNA exonuclease 1